MSRALCYWKKKIIISFIILANVTSDHKPILLKLEEEQDLSPIPFWFSPLWIGRDGFLNIISKAWDIPVFGSLNYVWERKLKNTKTALKDWIKLSQSNPLSERKEALKKLEEIELDMEE